MNQIVDIGEKALHANLDNLVFFDVLVAVPSWSGSNESLDLGFKVSLF